MMMMTVPQPRQEPCDICGDPSLEPWLEVNLWGVSDRWVHRCRSCGFRQVRPRLTTGELASLYPADYFDPAASGGYLDYACEAQRRRRDAYFLARRVLSRVPAARVLEVGCALGFLLMALRDKGCHVDGVDASSFAVYYAKTRFRLSVKHGELEEAQFPDRCFDLVVQKDLLEHVPSPRRHLLDTCRVMRPGAELWLVTPNGEANLRPLTALRKDRHLRPSPSNLSANDIPLLDQGHLSFFSLEHLRRLFQECGFVVVWARTIGVRRGLRALGVLAGQQRFSGRGVPVVRQSSTAAESLHEPDAEFARRAERIDAAVRSHHTRLREWVPYYYLHRVGKWFDALPATTGLGYDFEFLLKKR